MDKRGRELLEDPAHPGGESYEHMADRELVQAVVEGRSEAWDQVVTRYYDRLVRFAKGRVMEGIDPEGAVMTSFETAREKLDTLQNPDKLYGWLSRIVARRCSNVNRYERVRERGRVRGDAGDLAYAQAESGEASPEEIAIAREVAHRLQDTFSTFSPELREAMMLHVEGDSYDEIAGKLGVPRATIGTRIFRARERLRAALHDLKDASL